MRIKYEPSNGSEGTSFVEVNCMKCANCDPDPNGKKQCGILARAIMFSSSDKEYPVEWTYDSNGKPICTARIEWDWDKKGNPDNANQEHIIIKDPNQTSLFPE